MGQLHESAAKQKNHGNLLSAVSNMISILPNHLVGAFHVHCLLESTDVNMQA